MITDGRLKAVNPLALLDLRTRNKVRLAIQQIASQLQADVDPADPDGFPVWKLAFHLRTIVTANVADTVYFSEDTENTHIDAMAIVDEIIDRIGAEGSAP